MGFPVFDRPREKGWKSLGWCSVKNGSGIAFRQVFVKRGKHKAIVVVITNGTLGERWMQLRRMRSKGWGAKTPAQFEVIR